MLHLKLGLVFWKKIEHHITLHKGQCNLSSITLGLGTPRRINSVIRNKKNIGVSRKMLLKFKLSLNFRVIHVFIKYNSNLPNISQSNLTSFVLNTNVYLLDSSRKTSFCFRIISLEKAATFFFSTPKEQDEFV